MDGWMDTPQTVMTTRAPAVLKITLLNVWTRGEFKRCNLFCKYKIQPPLDVEGSAGVDGQGQQGEDHAEELNVRDPPC